MTVEHSPSALVGDAPRPGCVIPESSHYLSNMCGPCPPQGILVWELLHDLGETETGETESGTFFDRNCFVLVLPQPVVHSDEQTCIRSHPSVSRAARGCGCPPHMTTAPPVAEWR